MSVLLLSLLLGCGGGVGQATPGSTAAMAAQQVAPSVQTAAQIEALALEIEALCDLDRRQEPLSPAERVQARADVDKMQRRLAELERQLAVVERQVRAGSD